MNYLYKYTIEKTLLYEFEEDTWGLQKEYILGELIQKFTVLDLEEYSYRFQQFNDFQDMLENEFKITKYADITPENYTTINQAIKNELLIPCGLYFGETFFPPSNHECFINYLPYYLTSGITHPYLQCSKKEYHYGLYNNGGIFDYPSIKNNFIRNLSFLDADNKNNLSPAEQYYNDNGGQAFQDFKEKVLIMPSGELFHGYTFESAEEALTYEYYKMLEISAKTRKCQLCGNYFILKNKRAHFCSTKCQKSLSDRKQREKINSHPISKVYDTAIKRMCARKRNGKITQKEYNSWSNNANKIYLEYKKKYDTATTTSLKEQILQDLKDMLFEPI